MAKIHWVRKRLHFTTRGRCWFTARSDKRLTHRNSQKIHHFIPLPVHPSILPVHPSILPPPDTTSPTAALLFTHILLNRSSCSARFHFEVCKCGSLSAQRITGCVSVCGRWVQVCAGLTCLCGSRSALFPTRIIGNSSLSLTRRICLWNL